MMNHFNVDDDYAAKGVSVVMKVTWFFLLMNKLTLADVFWKY